MARGRQADRRGFWGTTLRVDLTAGRADFVSEEPALYEGYLGGVGLGARVLWDMVPEGADPMGPENVLGVTPGLLTDTGTVFTGRFSVMGKSPVTRGWADANAGGYFSPSLKRCALDGLFVSGACATPSYLLVGHGQAELRDASDLWGLSTYETEARLGERHGKMARCLCIGPAGERLSLMAGISTDRGRMAARGGLGAVMGAKRLKAVVVLGRERIGTADPKRVADLTRAFLKRLEGYKSLQGYMGDRVFGTLGSLMRKGPLFTRQPADLFRVMMKAYGTSSLTVLSAELGDSPVRNWAGVGFRDFPYTRSKNIGAEAIAHFETKRYGCFSCPLRCGAIVCVPEGDAPIEDLHRPEYETLCAFGTLLLNDDLQSIFRVNDLLNRAGMDTISCGGVVAFAIECAERGILSPGDLDGIPLSWGNGAAILALTKKIVEREGIGDLLADGVQIAAQKLGRGAEAFAVHCGGIEPPMHDPRFDPGFGMAYQSEPMPSRHTVCSLALLDLERLDRQFARGPKPPAFMTRKERYRPENKGEAMAMGSFYRMLVDCAGVCSFGTQIGGRIPLLPWIRAVTGWDLPDEAFLKTGERVEQIRHAFTLRGGRNPIRDFRLHPRVSGHPPLDEGLTRGVSLDPDALGRAFYTALGWDVETGLPERARMEGLGLAEVHEALLRGRAS